MPLETALGILQGDGPRDRNPAGIQAEGPISRLDLRDPKIFLIAIRKELILFLEGTGVLALFSLLGESKSIVPEGADAEGDCLL